MLEENPPVLHAKNALHDAHYNNAVNKIYHSNNKCNKNQNTVVIEIEENLFKDQMLSLNDAEEHKDKFMKHNSSLNVLMSITSLVMFYVFIK